MAITDTLAHLESLDKAALQKRYFDAARAYAAAGGDDLDLARALREAATAYGITNASTIADSVARARVEWLDEKAGEALAAAGVDVKELLRLRDLAEAAAGGNAMDGMSWRDALTSVQGMVCNQCCERVYRAANDMAAGSAKSKTGLVALAHEAAVGTVLGARADEWGRWSNLHRRLYGAHYACDQFGWTTRPEREKRDRSAEVIGVATEAAKLAKSDPLAAAASWANVIEWSIKLLPSGFGMDDLPELLKRAWKGLYAADIDGAYAALVARVPKSE